MISGEFCVCVCACSYACACVLRYIARVIFLCYYSTYDYLLGLVVYEGYVTSYLLLPQNVLVYEDRGGREVDIEGG